MCVRNPLFSASNVTHDLKSVAHMGFSLSSIVVTFLLFCILFYLFRKERKCNLDIEN